MTRLGSENKDTPKAIVTPTMRELGWASGFLEGEGSFGMAGKTQRVSAVQVQREPIDKLQRLFGGTVVSCLTPLKKTAWKWQTSGARARGIMLTLYTLMSSKRKQQILPNVSSK
jgi:hypothetical protein